MRFLLELSRAQPYTRIMVKNKKIKSNQKLQIIRYWGVDGRMTVRCTFKELHETLDSHTAGAVEEALQAILEQPCKGISATFKGMSLQVDLLD